ncbi:MAG: BACON domain-containing protein [Cytophagales bacterium]|nr:BACON domain-containing protein [Cytophagales bacterium]
MTDGAVNLNLYSRTAAAGTVSMGGNKAAGVAGAGSNYIVIVSGEGTPPVTNSLVVSSSSLSFIKSASSQNVSVTSNVSWTASDNQGWISVSPASGSNNGTVSVSVTANTGTTSRTGTVTISGGGITKTVSISQNGDTPVGDYPGAGIGLDGVHSYSGYAQFADVMKQCRWLNVASWNNKGYPTAAVSGSTVKARIGVDNGSTFPSGNYTLTWTGAGEVVLKRPSDISIVQPKSTTGGVHKVVFNTNSPEDYGIEIEITSYPVDDIHIYIPGTDENYPSLWNPEYLAYIEPFAGGPLRFMDANGTNGSLQKDWADRTPRNWSSYASSLTDNSTKWPIKGKNVL